MTDKEINRNMASLNETLRDHRYLAAFDTIEELLKGKDFHQLTTRLEQVKTTYNYMLHYLLLGYPDEGREQLLEDTERQLREIFDEAIRQLKMRDNNGYYYSTLRTIGVHKESLADLIKEYSNILSEMSILEAGGDDVYSLRQRKERVMVRLFNTLFTSIRADKEYAELTRYINSGYADVNIAIQSICALTLGLLTYYDKGKFTALLDIYEQNESSIYMARALMGIILTMIAHSDRIKADKKIMARLSLWKDSTTHYNYIKQAIRAIISTRETERANHKFKEEIMPEIMKMRPEVSDMLKKSNPKDIESSMVENNPEWEEILEKSNLTRKMEELSEMHSDGADLMMVTFSTLKQFPFFNTASNWFLPFDSAHTDLNIDADTGRFIDILTGAGQMVCASDLYSLAFAMKHMPDAQRTMITSQLSQQFDQMSEDVKSSLPRSGKLEFDAEIVRSVRDLYRFFCLFRNTEGFINPFALPLQFTQFPVVGEMMAEDDMLRLFSELYFKRGYYREALPLFLSIEAYDKQDATIYEKIGFCYQSLKQYTQALEAYEKASLLHQPGPWLVKRLAWVNRKLGNYAEAARYYTMALDQDTENLSLIISTAAMCVETGDIASGLMHYYHANYIDPENMSVLRGLAWAELLNKNFEKSGNFYDRIILTDPQPGDWLNAGHVALLQGKYEEAFKRYKRYAEGRKEEFSLSMQEIMPTLLELGADENIIRLIQDAILQNWNKI
ncbi:MAG: tetratricopeptide repeat protein [Lepagella sp.]